MLAPLKEAALLRAATNSASGVRSADALTENDLRPAADDRTPQDPCAQIMRTAPAPLMSAELISPHDSPTPVVIDAGRVDA
jgi:hypothetical protein